MSFQKLATALVTLSLLAPNAHTAPQESFQLETITVYGAGFGEPLSQAFPQTQVISSAQIQQSGLSSVGDILEKLGNLYMQQDLGINMNASPDMRGYGATSSNNTVILIDGVKISLSEQGPARIWSLPVESIDHIEIIRGSTSVLYGEGATSGAINIITNKQKEDFAIASFSLGSYGMQATSAYLSKSLAAGKLAVYGKSTNSNGYREQSENSLRSGGIQFDQDISNRTSVGFRIGENKDKANLPGFLTLSKWDQNPKAPQHSLSDLFERRPVNTSITYQVGSFYIKHEEGDVNWMVDFSRVESKSIYMDTTYPDTDPSFNNASIYNFHSRLDALNAKVKINHLGVKNNTLISGISTAKASRDVNQWSLPQALTQYSSANNALSNTAWFVQDDWRMSSEDRLTLGLRREYFNQDSSAVGMQFAPPTTFSKQSGYQTLNAYELQFSSRANREITNYVKVGQSYRLPNVDDLNRYCPDTCIQNLILSPQINKDFEVGTVYKNEINRGHLKYYRANITNEILFDKYDSFGKNINVPRTLREGLEFFNSYRYSRSLELNSSVNIIDAKFVSSKLDNTTGIDGKRIPGSPRYLLGLGANYSLNSLHSVSWATRLIGGQYPQGDTKNQFELGSYAVSDFGYRWTMSNWSILANVNNVFDKKYGVGVLASSSSLNYPYGIYPNWQRNFLLTLRYSLK